jgi:hypothetical protein
MTMTEPNNSEARRKRPPRKRSRNNRTRQNDLWRPVPALGDIAPIVPAADPTALLRSLGDPPLHGQGMQAEHYLAAVIERAAGLATALAASAGLLGSPVDL